MGLFLHPMRNGKYFVNGTVFTYLLPMRTGECFGNGADLLLFLYIVSIGNW